MEEFRRVLNWSLVHYGVSDAKLFYAISYIGHICIGEADAIDVPFLVFLVKILDLLQSRLETVVFFIGEGGDH